MTVALGKVKGRCKLRDLRYSRGLRTRIVAIVKFMGGFLCVCLTFLVSLINSAPYIVPTNNFCDSRPLPLGRPTVVLQELFLKETPWWMSGSSRSRAAP